MTFAKYPIIVTVLIWIGGVAAYAFFYVKSGLSIPGLQGYEVEWNWQLLFFGITRLPWLVAVLAGIILIELRLLNR